MLKNRNAIGGRGGRQTAMMSRQKLLFAENDQQVMETLGMYLESVECQPVFVGGGRELLEKLSGSDGEPEYRAVVLDTRIREMDILQMIRRIREKFSGSFSFIHRIFGAVNPANAMFAVYSDSLSFPMTLFR